MKPPRKPDTIPAGRVGLHEAAKILGVPLEVFADYIKKHRTVGGTPHYDPEALRRNRALWRRWIGMSE